MQHLTAAERAAVEWAAKWDVARPLVALLERLTAPAPGWSAEEERFLAVVRTCLKRHLFTDPQAEMVDRLLAMIDAQSDIMADYMADGQALRMEGAAEERGRVVARIEEVEAQWPEAPWDTKGILDQIDDLPPLPPPSPPSVARRRADAMEAMLRRWAEWWRCEMKGDDLDALMRDTRTVLGEGRADG